MAANLFPFPRFRAGDDSNNPLAGGKVYSYAAGTSTPLATYTDQSGGTPNANPVILDANGEADIWLAAGSSYKIVLKDSSDVQKWSKDNISSYPLAMTAITSLSVTGTSTLATLNITGPVTDTSTTGANVTLDGDRNSPLVFNPVFSAPAARIGHCGAFLGTVTGAPGQEIHGYIFAPTLTRAASGATTSPASGVAFAAPLNGGGAGTIPTDIATVLIESDPAAAAGTNCYALLVDAGKVGLDSFLDFRVAGTGIRSTAAGSLDINATDAAGTIALATAGISRWVVDASGNLVGATDKYLTASQHRMPRQNVALVNGANADVAIGSAGFVKITGPTGAFSISGFAGGADGRILVVYNSVAFAMTLTNNATSSAANRILTLTGADVVLAARQSAARFIYDSAQSLWILVSTY